MKVKKNIHFKHQHGVIMVIALILMVVIAISSVAAIRLSGVDELVNSNTRARTLALRAAESAINSCRSAVLAGTSGLKIRPSQGYDDEGIEWRAMATWSDASKVNTISDAELSSYTFRPQCVVEDITDFMEANSTSPVLERKVVAYRITARGFSPNYQDNGSYQTQGAQVWLQVVVGRTLK